MPEPTIADVLARLDLIEQSIRVLGLEQRAGHAELKLDVAELRSDIHNLDHATRDLWTEHFGHSHPEES